MRVIEVGKSSEYRDIHHFCFFSKVACTHFVFSTHYQWEENHSWNWSFKEKYKGKNVMLRYLYKKSKRLVLQVDGRNYLLGTFVSREKGANGKNWIPDTNPEYVYTFRKNPRFTVTITSQFNPFPFVTQKKVKPVAKKWTTLLRKPWLWPMAVYRSIKATKIHYGSYYRRTAILKYIGKEVVRFKSSRTFMRPIKATKKGVLRFKTYDDQSSRLVY
jgi:hypothetical protein